MNTVHLTLFIALQILTSVINLPQFSRLNDVEGEEELSSVISWRWRRAEVTEQEFYDKHKSQNHNQIMADWAPFLAKWKGGVCKHECKLPPENNCSLVDPSDLTVPSAKGPDASCCPLFKCFVHNNAYYSFHGVKGRGPTRNVTQTSILKPKGPTMVMPKSTHLNATVNSTVNAVQIVRALAPIVHLTTIKPFFTHHTGRSIGKIHISAKDSVAIPKSTEMPPTPGSTESTLTEISTSGVSVPETKTLHSNASKRPSFYGGNGGPHFGSKHAVPSNQSGRGAAPAAAMPPPQSAAESRPLGRGVAPPAPMPPSRFAGSGRWLPSFGSSTAQNSALTSVGTSFGQSPIGTSLGSSQLGYSLNDGTKSIALDGTAFGASLASATNTLHKSGSSALGGLGGMLGVTTEVPTRKINTTKAPTITTKAPTTTQASTTVIPKTTTISPTSSTKTPTTTVMPTATTIRPTISTETPTTTTDDSTTTTEETTTTTEVPTIELHQTIVELRQKFLQIRQKILQLRQTYQQL